MILKKTAISDIFALLSLTILILIFFNTTLTGHQMIVTPDFGGSDILYDGYPTKVFLAQELKQGRLPLWNPLIGTGYPLDGYPTGLWYPLNFLLFLLFPPHIALHWGLASSLFIAGAGMYFFIKVLTKSPAVSLVASVCFAFSGALIVHLNHYPVIQAVSLFPWLLVAIHQYLHTQKIFWAGLFSFFLGMSILIAFFQITFYSLLIVGGYLLWQKKYIHIFLLRNLAMSGLLGMGIGAIQFLPTITLLSQSMRNTGLSDASIFQYPYPWKHLLAFIYPYLFGDPRVGTYPVFSDTWGIFWENTGYIGLVPLGLGVFSLLSKQRKQVLLWIVLSVLTILFMMGKSSPFFFVHKIPPMSLFRIHSRMIFFLQFFFIILSSYGLLWVTSHLPKKRIVIALVLMLTTLDLLWFGMNYHYRGKTEEWVNQPETVTFLKQDPSWYRIASMGDLPLWNSLFTESGWKRGEAFLPLLGVLQGNYNLLFGIPQFGIYEALPTQVGRLQRSHATRAMLDISGVKYVLSPMVTEGYQEVFRTHTKPVIAVFENPSVFPRAWVASKVVPVQDRKEILPFLEKDSAYFLNHVFLEETINDIDPQATGTIMPVKENPTELIYTVSMTGQGVVVLADAWYPGWKAYLDGKEIPVLHANINQRAVVMPSGEHVLRFLYDPLDFKVGALITLVSISILIYATTIYGWHRRSRIPE